VLSRGAARALLTACLASWASIFLVALLTATPAGAVVTKAVEGAETTTVGLQPREAAHYWGGATKWNGLGKFETEPNAAAFAFGNDPSSPGHPGPVLHSVATYAVYWDPGDYYHGDWQGLIDGFLANTGTSGGELGNVFAVDAQYTDKTDLPATDRSTFHGAYTDTNPYPQSGGCTDPHPWVFGVPLLESAEPVCLTDGQLRTQLKTFINEQHGLQKGMGSIFYVLTPPGVTVCLGEGGPNGHCSEFDGTIAEISEYEEGVNTYPERLKLYEEELKKYEDEGEIGEPPVKPSIPTKPASYADYEKSFCSYHSDINPDGEEGGPDTILYATIPWIAGGAGDYHLAAADRTQGYACQDGGFEPPTKPNGEIQEKERVQARTAKQQEEFEEKTPREKREEEEARELGLGKPHEQEPNQISAEPNPDGAYDTGLADLIINQIAVEQQNTVTDPLLNGWQDPAGSELTDECRNSFFHPTGGSPTAGIATIAGTLENQSLATGKYYLNDAFNLASERLPYPAIPCLHAVALEPKFTVPNPVKAGEIVGFDGMESNITLNSAFAFAPSGATKENYATYTWNFGDGSPEVSGFAPGAAAKNSGNSPCAEPWLTPCAASVFHSYQYGGTYNVTLTIKDVGGNTASTTQQVVVNGPPAPSPEPGPAPGPAQPSGSTTGASGPGAPAGSGTTKPQLPAPVAAQAVASSSLAKTVKKGLVVRYSVNEQVTGTFNVLLAASIAKRIGLHLPLATGLPAGTSPQEIVGKALLITTKGGRGTIKIEFGKVTGARLRKLGKVSLMLQLNLRNASGRTATVLSKITLH